jgi:3-hydroxyisobutyrate dehydrogenase-like beta-hydroxyacid dehydrogenase
MGTAKTATGTGTGIDTDTGSGTGSVTVTVIGLGPMGRAMAAAHLDAGHRVTIWNRSPGKDTELVARGAVSAATAAEAVAASGLTVISLIDIDALCATLADVDLRGRTLVNLSSDTPAKARAASDWATARGAAYLSGGVNTNPDGVGKPDSSLFISGPEELYAAHRATLDVLGATDYRGPDPSHAQLYYQLNMIQFWTAFTGFYQAVAVARANGLTAADVAPYLSYTTDSLGGFNAWAASSIDAGDVGNAAARFDMCAASVEHILHTAADSGIDPSILQAHAALFRRGLARGFGPDGTVRLMELLEGAGSA